MDDIEPMASGYALTSFVFHQQHHGADDDDNTTRYADCVGDDESLMFPMTSSGGRSLLGFDLIASRCLDRASHGMSAADAVTVAASTYAVQPEYCHLDYATDINGDGSVVVPSRAAESCRGDVIGLTSPTPLMTRAETTAMVDGRCVYMSSKDACDDDVSVATDRFQQRHLQEATHWSTTTPPFVGQHHQASVVTSPSTTERIHHLNPSLPSRSQSINATNNMMSVATVGRIDVARCSIPSTFDSAVAVSGQGEGRPQQVNGDPHEVSLRRSSINSS